MKISIAAAVCSLALGLAIGSLRGPGAVVLFDDGTAHAAQGHEFEDLRVDAEHSHPGGSSPACQHSETSVRREPRDQAVWDRDEVRLPIDFLRFVEVPGLRARPEGIAVPEPLQRILGLDQELSQEISRAFGNTRDVLLEDSWKAMTVVRGEGQSLVVDIPAPSATLGRARLEALEADLGEVLGVERAAFLMKSSKELIEWELLGFGAHSRVFELEPRSKGGYHVRESLRRPLGSAPSGLSPDAAERFENFELAAREYYSAKLPGELEGRIEL